MGELENIAAVLEEEAEWLPDVPDSEEKFEKKFGSFVVRYSPTSQAVQEMASKFFYKDKVTTKNVKLSKPSSVRKYSKRVYEGFVRDGEMINAANYNQLFDK